MGGPTVRCLHEAFGTFGTYHLEICELSDKTERHIFAHRFEYVWCRQEFYIRGVNRDQRCFLGSGIWVRDRVLSVKKSLKRACLVFFFDLLVTFKTRRERETFEHQRNSFGRMCPPCSRKHMNRQRLLIWIRIGNRDRDLLRRLWLLK